MIAGDKAVDGVYNLPSSVAHAAQEQYERDIARVHGTPVQSNEVQYQEFLESLGGGPLVGSAGVRSLAAAMPSAPVLYTNVHSSQHGSATK